MRTLRLSNGRIVMTRRLNESEQCAVGLAIQTAIRDRQIPNTSADAALVYLGEVLAAALAPYIEGATAEELKTAFKACPNDARVALGVACGAIG